MCTEMLSVVDIIYYFEIYACFYLDECSLDTRKFSNIIKWMNEVAKVQEIINYQLKFEESVDRVRVK